MESKKEKQPLIASLFAGGAAGLSVDIILFPLDTIKTRLQASEGFKAAGGFRGLYAGISSTAAGSAPSAATFFFSYEMAKNILEPKVREEYRPFVHMIAACFGEVVACFVRTPFEVVKQRAQTLTRGSVMTIAQDVSRHEGLRGFYRGYTQTVLREMKWSKYQGRAVDSWQSAVCGMVSGGIAAGATTPLDVIKTRVMLAKKESFDARSNVYSILLNIWKTEKVKGLFSGVVPRVMWISLGGGIYFGVYEWCKTIFNSNSAS